MATGKYTKLIDDRTGFKINYKDAKTEWTGARVHKSEWEAKHPALTPPRPRPEKPLRNTRPGNNEQVDVNLYLGGILGDWTTGETHHGSLVGNTLLGWDHTAPTLAALPTTVVGTMSLGSLTLTAISLPSGVEGISAVGSLQMPPFAGIELTGGLGTLALSAITFPTGLESTSALGFEVPEAAVVESGFLMTASLGTATVVLPGWGMGTWNTGQWDN